MESEFHGVSRRGSRNGGIIEASSWFLVIFLLVFVFIFAELVCLGLQLVGLLVEFGSIANGTMAIGLGRDLLVLHTWKYCTNIWWATSEELREKR